MGRVSWRIVETLDSSADDGASRAWRQQQSHGGRWSLQGGFCRRRGGYMRFPDSRTLASSADSTFPPPPLPPPPPPPVQICEETKSPDGERGGWYLQSIDRGGTYPRESWSIAVLSPTVPPSGGGNDLNIVYKEPWGGRNKGNTIDLLFCGFTVPSFFVNSSKIWPIMSWSPARLQPRGPSCPPLLSPCLQVMETVNTLSLISTIWANVPFPFIATRRGSTPCSPKSHCRTSTCFFFCLIVVS